MSDLPARPDLDQLRHQARDLLRAARAGDADAAARIREVSLPLTGPATLTLTAARLAIAREYGFPSWARLKAEVEARTRDLAEQAAAFCQASIGDWTGRAARMLAATPELATWDIGTSVVLGDAPRVRTALARDPAIATRRDPRTGWTALHAVSASRWHRLDPARAAGLTEVARMLLDAGADPAVLTSGPRAGWKPLRCAVAGAANPDIVRLLLERGAVPDDHDLYLACFGADDRESLRLLLDRAGDIAETTALSAPISVSDTEAVRMLLAAGADPNRPLPAGLFGASHEDEPPLSPLSGAIKSGCPAELVELLLSHGADPDAAAPDGRSPYRLATSQGRADLTALLGRYGARDDATSAERFLSACLRGDEAAARELTAEDPGLASRLTQAEHGALALAAERGDTDAVRLMLDFGFPIAARENDSGGTALHAAAYAGSAEVARLLLARGADIESRDTTWDSTPLEWAKVGSGERPRSNPRPDWAATVRILLEAGASTEAVELSADDTKPASPEVADILRAAGVRERAADNGGSLTLRPRTLRYMPWPFRNRGMVERTCLDCGQIWVVEAAMAGRKPPRGVSRGSVAMDMRYAQERSPFTKTGTDQFLASTHLHDADAENKDFERFRELQTCPKCRSGRYAQRRIRGLGDTAAPRRFA